MGWGWASSQEREISERKKTWIFFCTEGYKSLVKVCKNSKYTSPLAFDTLSVLCCVKKNTFSFKIQNYTSSITEVKDIIKISG